MPSLTAVVYTSSATRELGEPELEALLAGARERNLQQGITGVLLYHDGSFFQYFEGEEAAVEQTYRTICNSRLHRGIIEMMHAPIKERVFPDWLMGFTRAPASTVLQLSQANWASSLVRPSGPGRPSDGLALLVQFWKVSSSTRAGRS